MCLCLWRQDPLLHPLSHMVCCAPSAQDSVLQPFDPSITLEMMSQGLDVDFNAVGTSGCRDLTLPHHYYYVPTIRWGRSLVNGLFIVFRVMPITRTWCLFVQLLDTHPLTHASADVRKVENDVHLHFQHIHSLLQARCVCYCSILRLMAARWWC